MLLANELSSGMSCNEISEFPMHWVQCGKLSIFPKTLKIAVNSSDHLMYT